MVDILSRTAHACHYYSPMGQLTMDCLKTWGYITPCTVATYGTRPISQLYAECQTCSLTGEEGVCRGCIETCHKGHKIHISLSDSRRTFYCHCGGCSNLCNSMKPVKIDQAKSLVCCTYAFVGRKDKWQPSYQCSTCFSTVGKYLCEPCSKSTCHMGHLIVYKGMQTITCACNDRMKGCPLILATLGKDEDRPKESLTTPTVIADKETEENMDCIVCMAAKKDTIFYKCGHLACCYDCSLLMRGSTCPICRTSILDVCKVYHV
eukprot:TRINITY_DN15915_c0_g1_i1.p1 TRINITY_DN15915_c0_g1~~TRINITY_DN15915_c0_g1_i1.p1  ORF type:complete len:263 (-),score=28.00 TRINITY_DN15915_c0_g1_i1:107-895(-)